MWMLYYNIRCCACRPQYALNGKYEYEYEYEYENKNDDENKNENGNGNDDDDQNENKMRSNSEVLIHEESMKEGVCLKY